jgi:hypothetical protein
VCHGAAVLVDRCMVDVQPATFLYVGSVVNCLAVSFSLLTRFKLQRLQSVPYHSPTCLHLHVFPGVFCYPSYTSALLSQNRRGSLACAPCFPEWSVTLRTLLRCESRCCVAQPKSKVRWHVRQQTSDTDSEMALVASVMSLPEWSVTLRPGGF